MNYILRHPHTVYKYVSFIENQDFQHILGEVVGQNSYQHRLDFCLLTAVWLYKLIEHSNNKLKFSIAVEKNTRQWAYKRQKLSLN